MKTRHVALLTGTLLLAATGVAQAHPEARYAHVPATVGGSISVWGGSHTAAGWAGTFAVGSPAVVAAPVLPVTVVPHGDRYGPRGHLCRHGYTRQAYPAAHHRHHASGRKHGRGHGRGHGYRD